jgi:hypothetical protein
MKVKAFVDVLGPYAAVIAAHGGGRLASQIAAIKDAWTPVMSWNVKDLLTRGWPATTVAEADESAVREFRLALVRLQEVVNPIAKQDFIKDLSALIEALEPHDQEDLTTFVDACREALSASKATKSRKGNTNIGVSKPANEKVVANAVRELKETYKDADRFMAVYEQLSANRAISAADLAAIATEFSYRTAPSTKRTESLRRIWVVHESYATSAAKSESTGGKSAA